MSVILLGGMLALVGWVVGEAGLVGSRPGGVGQAAVLPGLMLLAGATGVWLGESRRRIRAAHAVAVLLGVVTVLVACAWSLSDRVGEVVPSLGPLREASTRFLDDLLGSGGPTEPLAALLLVGAIAWTTGYLAAFDLVRRDRALASVGAMGTLLIVVTTVQRVPWERIGPAVIVFTGASLVLILRAMLSERRGALARHRVRVAPGAELRLLRGGMVVGVVALVVAGGLQGVVAIPPLGSLLGTGFEGPGSSADARALRDRSRIADTWVTSDQTVLTVRPDDGVGRYLAGAAYARFDGDEWLADAGTGTATLRAAGPIGSGVDHPAGIDGWTKRVSIVVTGHGPPASRIVAPAILRSVDRPVDLHVAGPGGVRWGVSAVEPLRSGERYEVTADGARDPAGPPIARLAGAALPVPAWADAYRASVPADVLDADARALAASFLDGEAAMDPFRVATRMEAWFAGTDRAPDAAPTFGYPTDIRGMCGPEQGVVACLLANRVGFCQHYATAMTLMLQSLGIPARYVEGYLPGRDGGDGSWVVPASAAHAWVEVFFPAAGWVRFDPTPPGNLRNGQVTTGRQLRIELAGEGAGRSSLRPAGDPTGAAATAAATTTDDVGRDPDAGVAHRLDGPLPPGLVAPLVALVLVSLLLGGLALVMRAVRHRPVVDRDPVALYRGIVAHAARVGLYPRSGDTELEFAAALGRAVPEAARDVRRLAHASVASTYGRRSPDDAAIEELVASFRVARRALGPSHLRRSVRR